MGKESSGGVERSPLRVGAAAGSGSPAASAAAAQAAAEGLPTANSVVPPSVAAGLGLGLRPRPGGARARAPASGASSASSAVGAGTVARPPGGAPKAAGKAASVRPATRPPPAASSGAGTVARPPGTSPAGSGDAAAPGTSAAAPEKQAGNTKAGNSGSGTSSATAASSSGTPAPAKAAASPPAASVAASAGSTEKAAAGNSKPVVPAGGSSTTRPASAAAATATAATAGSSTAQVRAGTAGTSSTASTASTAASAEKKPAGPATGASKTPAEASAAARPAPAAAGSSASPAAAGAAAAGAGSAAGPAAAGGSKGTVAAPPAGVLAILGGMSDFLASVSVGSNAVGSYSEEQRRGCIACALRLAKPELGNVLARLHNLAASCWAHTGCSDLSALKALAVLLDMSLGSTVTTKDQLSDALMWQLARQQQKWKQENRLVALAIIIKAPPKADSEAELVQKALKSSASLATGAFCVLQDAAPGTTLDEAKKGVVLKLAERVGAPASTDASGKAKVTYPGLEILALLLGCEAKEAIVLERAAASTWARPLSDATKKIVTGQSSKPPAAAPAASPSPAQAPAGSLDAQKVKSLRKEPRDRQLLGLMSMLKPRREERDRGEAWREAGIVRALASKAKTLQGDNGDTILPALGMVLGVAPSGTAAEGSEAANSAWLEAMARHICSGCRQLPSQELRLHGFACLLQAEPKVEALLVRLARAATSRSLPKELCSDIFECVLLEQTLSAEKPHSTQATLQAALQRCNGLTPEARRTVTDALLTPLASAGATPTGATASAAGNKAARRPSEQPASAAAPPAKRSKTEELRAAKDEMKEEAKEEAKEKMKPEAKAKVKEVDEEPQEKTEEGGDEAKSKKAKPAGVKGKASKEVKAKEEQKQVEEPEESEDEYGWGALKALVDEDDEDDDEEAEADAEADEDDEGQADDDEEAGEDGDLKEDEEEEEEEEDEEEDVEKKGRTDDAKKKGKEAEAEAEEDDNEEEEEEDGELDELEFSGSEDVESYGGSDLDALDFGDSDMESLEASDDEEGTPQKAGGLLTSMFMGGSLHSEDKRKTLLNVTYPKMLWKGEDICVVQKPADWICSASDVDKKKGRKLDPNEDLRVKGFKVMKDLMDYKFQEREKKYVHWWIQLTYDVDRDGFPNLFDVDQNYGLCHRLDRETSGTVLVGITKQSRTQMRECFHRHYVRKLYVCLCHGFIDKREQTVDRNLEAMGQKAKLDPRGKRARTHVKVLGYFTRTHKNGRVDEYTLCTCEIAEGRMHQIRLHMSAALGAPIISEFYYQKTKQMIEDRRWCARTFLHAYAVGFPDVSGADQTIGLNGASAENEAGEIREDKQQEWHCCVCPLTPELRKALSDLKPREFQLKGIDASKMLATAVESGLVDVGHKDVHCLGTENRKEQIDDIYFPWSSRVNPIQEGDLHKAREDTLQRELQQSKPPPRRFGGRERSRDRDDDRESPISLRAKPKARQAARARPARDLRCESMSPRRPLRKRACSAEGPRKRIGNGRGRLRSPGPPPPPARSRSCEGSMSPTMGVPPPPARAQARRVRSRSGRPIRRRSLSRRRLPNAAPASPSARSMSMVRRRRKRLRRDGMSPGRDMSPAVDRGGIARSQPPLGGRPPRRGGSGGLSGPG
eukprot:TRINITY_DN5802_c0_g2_i1.p1 TRINITY_DN5802_c0_g2~~TRINITY_DN5802_c0_g2_i1.p1  ORF type:complete len:1659 (-),score=464.27 TRINITY_DN5802_c0_g2_i1:42-4958(-)